MSANKDILQRFLFEHASIRGEVVHLDNSWAAILDRHNYPPVARELLGEALAASTLLAATLKLDGALTMQISGDGPITMLVADCTSKRTIRGMVSWNEDATLEAAPLQDLMRNGKLVITLERTAGERYQGIVDLEGGNLAAALGQYLQRSEQLDTHLWLAVDNERATGMLMQRLPGFENDEDPDTWNRAITLAETIRPDELMGLSSEEIIHRLFSEEDIRLFDPEYVRFECSCSHERVTDMLRSLGKQELDEAIADEGLVAVNCQFCNHRYEFDQVDVDQLFSDDPSNFSSQTIH